MNDSIDELIEILEELDEPDVVETFDTEYDKNIPIYSIETDDLKMTFWNSNSKEKPIWSELKEDLIDDLKEMDVIECGSVSNNMNEYRYEIEEK